MDRKHLDAVIADALNDAELKSSDIPAIDLYVDQIINLVADKLKQGSERYMDRQLTKTMINNYSKDGLITPIKGKKYSREQITQILTVYTLKNTISIGEIKRMLYGAYGGDSENCSSVSEVYDRHIDIKHKNREYASEIVDRLIADHDIDIEDKISYISAVCAVISLSAQLKNIAIAMIDSEFPELFDGDEKDKDKDKDKDKKEEKSKEKKKKKEEKDKKESTENEEL